MNTFASAALLSCCALALLGCEGDGSDIGPRHDPLPSASAKVNVFDDQGRAVVGARVSLVESGAQAVTGRNGRGDLFVRQSGLALLCVDGANAAAVDGDRLGTLCFRAPSAGDDILVALHLPDVAQSQVALAPRGQPSAGVILANPLDGGGVLTVPPGATVTAPGIAGSVELRSGVMQTVHLPGELPVGDAILFGNGIYIDPPGATFTPGADLRVVNDLLATGVVTLYRLDSTSGEWATAGAGIAAAGEITVAGAITHGGLYVFGVSVIGGAVRGSIVDARGRPLSEALVSVDGRRTVSSGGVYTMNSVAAVTADGAPRSAEIEVYTTGRWLPASVRGTVAMSGVEQVVADELVLDTVTCTNIRIQQITRAVATPVHPARLSSLYEGVALTATSDARGQVIFEDVPSLWFGFQDAYPRDRLDAYYAQAVGYAEPGQRWLDAFQFFDREPWFRGSRSSRVLACDAIGGGPLYGAILVRGDTPGEGYFGTTRENGVLWAERSLEQRVTCTYGSARDGRSVMHAFTIDTPNGEHIELPMRQVLREPLGAFDRHGIVEGAVAGANPAAELRLRTTRRIELQDWWDQAFAGTPIRSALPIDLDPQAASGEFRCGVDRAGGNVVVAEVGIVAGAMALDRVGIAADVVPEEGAAITLPLALDYLCDTSFEAAGALADLDPAIASSALAFDLALEQPSGRAVDVVRGIDGNHVATGDDLEVVLPALAGDIAGHAWLVAFGGAASTPAGDLAQRCLLRFDGAEPPSGALLPVPALLAPVPDAEVSASGFTVELQLPPGAQYGTIELRSEDGAELRLWDVVIPPWTTEFAFVTLPTEATSPLESGREYWLTLSAFAAQGGPLADSEDPYRDLTTFYQSIGPVERGVFAISSRAIRITTL